MKTVILAILSLLLAESGQAQYDYPIDTYSASDMNVKGKVKRITEVRVYTDKKGRVNNGEQKMKYVYDFDASGRLTSVQVFELKSGEELERTSTYTYVGDKVSRINTKEAYVNPYTNVFSYSASQVFVRNGDGDLLEARTLSNGRVTETKYYGAGHSTYRNRYVYEYNGDGQVQKRFYKDDAEAHRKYYSSEAYQYNRSGDRQKKERYNNEGALDDISNYTYTYGSQNNWTKCSSVSYAPGEDEEDHIYTQYTRVYEYY
ncbi:hypothetical protein [Flaviaesturariibacter aridisoli]|uniref:YD repeat-containing protein n=1 Tax=Flaviaesturariibacter aridisoli TaxID=2545761 RepID=A0A4R4E8M2_9BACT|nr:hypothetical protein [Flaviaesturariibacter aridisoli]TCZ74115.1 hypothetical protein E0486_03300 [Flaviaesturariibacter aridisoli]